MRIAEVRCPELGNKSEHFAAPVLWSFFMRWGAIDADNDDSSDKAKDLFHLLKDTMAHMINLGVEAEWKEHLQLYSKHLVTMTMSVCNVFADSFSQNLDACFATVGSLKIDPLLATGVPIADGQALAILRSDNAAKLHELARILRRTFLEATDFVSWASEYVEPLVAKLSDAGSMKLTETLAVRSTTLKTADENTGAIIGRALGNLSALQVLFGSPADKRASLASRLTVTLASQAKQKVFAKMTGDSKLMGLLASAAKDSPPSAD